MNRLVASTLGRIDALLFDRFSTQYIRILEEEIVGICDSLLDVGCGGGSPIGSFTHKISYSVGVDGFEQALIRSRSIGIHSTYRNLDLLQIGNEFATQSFDCVLASDVIEHLSKSDGAKLIEMMERIARNKVIIFTPNGFLPQTAYGGNPLQEHLSGWETPEMQARGYHVVGINGWRRLRGEHGRLIWRPRPLWKAISYLTQDLVQNHPTWAFQLLCIKDLVSSGGDLETPVLGV